MVSTLQQLRTIRSGLVLAAALSVCLGGGCGKNKSNAAKQSAAAKAKAKAEEEAKTPLSVGRVTPLLSESIVETTSGSSLRLAKPGHWTAAVQRMESRVSDLEGRTELRFQEGKATTHAWPHTEFELTFSRPAVLAKGRPKRVASELVLPLDAKQARIAASLSDSSGSPIFTSPPASWRVMPPQQYFLVVLAREPSRYAYLSQTTSVRAPFQADDETVIPNYRVTLADATKPLPLPASTLEWTSIAYVWWDNVNPDRLDPAQQEALVDWLHWGGRLVISGPDSLASLRGSFLDKYLPADVGATRSFAAADLAALNEAWTKRSEGAAIAAAAPAQPWSGIELKPRPGARSLPGAAGLLVESDVGAGGIVVSAVGLTQRGLTNWPGFDGVLNGALLRRPARHFRREGDDIWQQMQTHWAEYQDRARDAYFTTPLRWFARDAGAKANSRTAQVDPSQVQPAIPPAPMQVAEEVVMEVDQPGGLGQWSDFSAVSDAAREALTVAAGVRVPGAGFVLACLAAYLVVLVPLNWMTFSALGKVEWAWISAPIIAILGTLVVVRQAQLDIGFVRSHTEIALLELYGDHPRGHLSRYTAFYTSLADTYDVTFEDSSAVATPFPRDSSYVLPTGESPTPIALEKYDKPRLSGLAISSASTQMVHAEQMYKLPGAIRLAPTASNPNLLQLANRTGINLADATVVRRRHGANGKWTFDASWLGQVRDGDSVLIDWRPITLSRDEAPFGGQRKQAAKVDVRKRLDVDKLLALALAFPRDSDPIQGGREEFRLVARVDDVLPGIAVTPAASQTVGTTVVLARLRLGPPRDQSPDVNSPADVKLAEAKVEEATPEE